MTKPLPAETFAELIPAICPKCNSGIAATQRPDTKEWVHNTAKGGVFTHAICFATNLRNSHWNPEYKNET